MVIANNRDNMISYAVLRIGTNSGMETILGTWLIVRMRPNIVYDAWKNNTIICQLSGKDFSHSCEIIILTNICHCLIAG